MSDALTSILNAAAPGPAKGTKIAASWDVTATAGSPAQREEPADAEAVRAAAKHIEAHLKSMGRALEFRVDAETGRTVVTVRDTASGDVIRQIPNDEVLHLAKHLHGRANALVDIEV